MNIIVSVKVSPNSKQSKIVDCYNSNDHHSNNTLDEETHKTPLSQQYSKNQTGRNSKRNDSFESNYEQITLKIQIKSLPEDGKVNKELIDLLSKELEITKNKISIIKGLTFKFKTISIKYEYEQEKVRMLEKLSKYNNSLF